METLKKLCQTKTELADAQIEILEQLSVMYQLAADLVRAHLTVYARMTRADRLLILSRVQPNTSFSRYHLEYEPGEHVRAVEEPLVWKTLSKAVSIWGMREWAWGYMADMCTYPILDEMGNVIACVSFEMHGEDQSGESRHYLLDTVYMMLRSAEFPLHTDLYRSLSANDGIIILDRRGKIQFADAAAKNSYKVLGVAEMQGHHMFDREFTIHIKKETTIAQKSYEKELEIGNLILLQRTIPIRKNEKIIYSIVIVSDVTELKKKEKELLIKSAVIQEIHHRVKNNLQTIASLLRLQSRRTNSTEAKAALQESVNRILSISVVHEFLSQQDAENIDVVEVAKNILDLIMHNMLEPGFELVTQFEGETAILPSEHASSLALVINELIQNSIEHAFVGRERGLIGLQIARVEDNYRIDLYDDGVGLPQDFQLRHAKSLGLQIVRTLIEEDLGGEIFMENRRGAHVRIIIPRWMKGGK